MYGVLWLLRGEDYNDAQKYVVTLQFGFNPSCLYQMKQLLFMAPLRELSEEV
jgi:hypothetical protein